MSKVKLPKSLTRVTWFSKAIALFIFLVFVLSSFWAGMMYQKNIVDVVVSATGK